MIHDMVELEKAGIPTATILSEGFQDDAIASAKAFGMRSTPFTVVPKVYNNVTVEEAIEQTDPCVDDVVRLLTTQSNGYEIEKEALAGLASGPESFEGADQLDALAKFNEAFLDNDWGDGFPLIPPTAESVDEMLTGTTLPRDEVVCLLPPGSGYATVEKIAANAVMAGCSPEHLPVVIAGAKALSMLDPQDARGFLMSTSANGPLFLVNGPIAGELGINSKRAALGPGRQSRVNIVIGRALILTLKNVGHWYPGHLDMDTIGTTRKFPQLIAENEDDTPWEPFHVEQGFDMDASTITVFSTGWEADVGDQGNNTGEGLLRTIAYSCTANGGSYIANLAGELDDAQRGAVLILMAPAHARPIAGDGFTKRSARTFIHAHAKRPARELINNFNVPEKVRVAWKWLYDLPPMEQERVVLPVQESADRYYVVCAGANDRAKDLVFGTNTPATAEIEHRAIPAG